MRSNNEECSNKCISLFMFIFSIPFLIINLRLSHVNYINSLPQELCHIKNDTMIIYQHNTFSTKFKIGRIIITEIYNDKLINNNSTFIYPSSKYINFNSEKKVKETANIFRNIDKFICYYDEKRNISYDRPPKIGFIIIFIFIPNFLIMILLFCCAKANYIRYRRTLDSGYRIINNII